MRIRDGLKPMAVPMASLTRWPGNPKQHDLDFIAYMLTTYGQWRPAVVQRSTGRVLVGNGMHEAAERMGATELAVEYLDVDDTEAKRVLLADNRAGERGGMDEALLAPMLADLRATEDGLAGTGYSEQDAALLLEEEHGVEGFEAESDDPSAGAAVSDAEPVTVRGTVWELGGHRLMCGDSRDRSDVAELVAGARLNLAFTSPPYAEQRAYDASSGFVPIPPEEYVEWFEPVAANVAEHLADDGSWFVNIKPAADGLDTHLYVMDLVTTHVREWGWHFATEFCWERRGMPKNVTLRFKNQFEPVYQFARGRWKVRPEQVSHLSKEVPVPLGPGGGNTEWASDQGSVDHFDEREKVPGLAYPGNRLPAFASGSLFGHAAAFPVGLPRWFTMAFTDPGDTVYDPFSGTGTTILAAEMTDRVGYGMELSPRYCDVICARYQHATGIVPVRDGQRVDFSDRIEVPA
ncbi:DNA modification methylase [Streptomyces sp. NPDC087300]|uniref:DNA modification methylase n=1 Tax=Streptomyces sp. NPDC087300 TaxID=3365780 RepID=UPI0037F19A60